MFRSELEEMRALIAEAKKNKVTKKNKVLYNAEEKINKLNQSYNLATKEVLVLLLAIQILCLSLGRCLKL